MKGNDLKMKKVIYGLLIIVGGLLIASNFMLDSSKIDHKIVNASGTTCKWISESGYGLGPHYVIPSKINSTDFYYDSSNSRIRISILPIASFEILPCSPSVNYGVSKDGFKIYDSLGNLYNNEIKEKDSDNNNKYVFLYYTEVAALSTETHYYWMNIENGQFNLKNMSRLGDFYFFYDSWANSPVDVLTFEEDKKIFSRYTPYHIQSFDGLQIRLSNYPTDIDGDGEWTFTCVCAEY